MRKLIFNEISLIFAISGMVLSAFIYLTSPQKEQNVAIELLRAQVVAQERTIETITKTQQNDTHEVKTNLEALRKETQELRENIVKLGTIIEERIPKKK